MSTIRTRAAKASDLTPGEADANFEQKVVQKTTTYAILVSDNRNTIEGNHASTPFTITLGDAATMIAAEIGDFQVTISNINAAAVTVARAGSDTIDGGTASLVLEQNNAVTLQVISAGNGYESLAKVGGTLVASTGTFSDTTNSTSGSTGSIQTEGGIGAKMDITTDRTLMPLGSTSPGDLAAVGYAATVGLMLTGQGSTNDVTIRNDAGTSVIEIPTGTTNVDIRGDVTSIIGTFKPLGDTSAGDAASFGYTATEGAIITGQGSTNDVTIKNDADADVISIPTGTTGVTFAGALTVDGIVQPKIKIIDIGDWNMDSTSFITVTHGLTMTDIRSISVLIRGDDTITNYVFPAPDDSAVSSETVTVISTDVILSRAASGVFDSTAFDSTSFNRGWVTIQYV